MLNKFVDIPGYEGLYKANRLGQIWSCRRNKIIKPKLDKYGYHTMTLYKDGKRKSATFHRLIAITFIPNTENKPEVNHKNGIKTKNDVENLEWVTTSENQKHAFRIGLGKPIYGEKNYMFGKGYLRAGEKCPTAKLTNSQAIKIRELYSTKQYTHKQLGEMFNVSDSSIYLVVNNRTFVGVNYA